MILYKIVQQRRYLLTLYFLVFLNLFCINVKAQEYLEIENPVSAKPALCYIKSSQKSYELRANSLGYFERVSNILPFELVPIEIFYPDGAENDKIVVSVQDGGVLDNQSKVKLVYLDNQKKASFSFRVSNQPGIYRLLVYNGDDMKLLQLWVSARAIKKTYPRQNIIAGLTAEDSIIAQCGNACPEGASGCHDCPPPRPGINYFSSYTGSVRRETRDLEVWGGVGEEPLVFNRYYNSRFWGLWNFSFQFLMSDNGVDEQGRPLILIHFPEGSEVIFTQNEQDPNLWLPPPGVDKRLFREGNNFFLQTGKGYRYRFRRVLSLFGPIYQLQDFRDNNQNIYKLSYGLDQQFVTRVTEPAGRYLQISYGLIPGFATKVTTSDGRSINANYDTYNDGMRIWVRLRSVNYGDGTQAVYNYVQQEPGIRPLLEHAIDPRHTGAAVNMKYTYQYIVTGFLKEERNGVSGEVMATLNTEPEKRTICYPNGRVQQYDIPFVQDGKTSAYTDGLGAVTRFTYDDGGIGFLKSETDALGRVTTYDQRTVYGNLLEMTLPDGSKRKWTRDNLDQVLTYTDELGRVTSYTRDDHHRIAQILYPDNTKELFTYNGFGQVLTHTLRNGGIEENVYDPRGLKLSYKDALGNVSGYTYDSADRLASLTDARGNITRNEYNERGLMIRVINADGSSRKFTYDDFGNLTGITNEIGNTWTTVFDEFRRPVSAKDPLNRETKYDYDLPGGICGCTYSNNAPTSIIFPGGTVTKFEYDVEWKLTRETTGAGSTDEATAAIEYDLKGNKVATIDARGKTFLTAYDSRDRKLSAKDPLGNITTWFYDAVGNITAVKRPDGGSTSYSHDNMNRRTEVTDAKGQVTKMQYDAEGNMTAVTDAQNQQHLFQYDLLNRVTRMAYPDGSFESNLYDPAGNLMIYRNRAGNIRTYTYDNRNREILSDWNDVTPDVTHTYDEAGRILTLESSASILRYDYTAANELRSESQSIAGGGVPKVFQYAYDADGFRSTMTYAYGNMLKYDYTARKQLASVSLDGSLTVVKYQYDLSGNRVNKELGNNTKTLYTYDDHNRPLSVDNQHPTGALARFDYNYDQVNRLNFVKRNNGNGDVFSYDALDQVTSVRYEVSNPEGIPVNPLRTVSYDYDPAGNRSVVTSNAVMSTYSSNILNQYNQAGDFPATYDPKGNLETAAGWTLRYDAQNRLLRAEKEAILVEFVYDARNRCVKRSINGTASFFYYDEWNIVEERNAVDELLAGYIHGDMTDEILAKGSPGLFLYYHYDAQGNVTHLSGVEGNIVESYSYDIYGVTTIKDGNGQVIPASAFGNRFMFTGREFIQEVGIYDYRNRVYSPHLGRFLQTDPIRFLAGDVNLYRYVVNNPVNLIDPLGQGWLSAIGYFAAGVVVGAVITAAIIVAAPVVASVAAAGLVAVGVSAATATTVATAAVTGTLGVVAVVGGVATSIDVVQNAAAGNWDNVAFSLGSLAGGALVGGSGGGRFLANKVSPTPSTVPKSWNPFTADKGYGFVRNPKIPFWRDVYNWLGTGPTPTSGGASAMFIAALIAMLCR